MNKINKLTTSAIFASLGILAVLAYGMPLGSLIASVGSATIMAVLTVRVGAYYGAGATFVASVIAFLVSPSAALMGVSFLATGVLVGVGIKRGDDLLDNILSAAAGSAVLLILIALASAMGLLGPKGASGLVEIIRLLAMDSAGEVGITQKQFMATLDTFITLLPSAFVFTHILVGLVAAVASAGLLKRMGERVAVQRFTELILTPHVRKVVLPITIVFMLLLLVNHSPFLVNAVSLTTGILGLVGVAGIIGLIFSRVSGKGTILVIVMVASIFLGGSVIYLYALFDSSFDFRGLRKKAG